MRLPTPIAAAVVAGFGLILSPSASLAQSRYPNRPGNPIVGFAPGGTTGIVP